MSKQTQLYGVARDEPCRCEMRSSDTMKELMAPEMSSSPHWFLNSLHHRASPLGSALSGDRVVMEKGPVSEQTVLSSPHHR